MYLSQTMKVPFHWRKILFSYPSGAILRLHMERGKKETCKDTKSLWRRQASKESLCGQAHAHLPTVMHGAQACAVVTVRLSEAKQWSVRAGRGRGGQWGMKIWAFHELREIHRPPVSPHFGPGPDCLPPEQEGCYVQVLWGVVFLFSLQCCCQAYSICCYKESDLCYHLISVWSPASNWTLQFQFSICRAGIIALHLKVVKGEVAIVTSTMFQKWK